MGGLPIWSETSPAPNKEQGSRYFHTGTQVRIGVALIRPIDVELVVVPVAVRHVAVRVAGAPVVPHPIFVTGNLSAKFPALLPEAAKRLSPSPAVAGSVPSCKLARVRHAVSFRQTAIRCFKRDRLYEPYKNYIRIKNDPAVGGVEGKQGTSYKGQETATRARKSG